MYIHCTSPTHIFTISLFSYAMSLRTLQPDGILQYDAKLRQNSDNASLWIVHIVVDEFVEPSWGIRNSWRFRNLPHTCRFAVAVAVPAELRRDFPGLDLWMTTGLNLTALDTVFTHLQSSDISIKIAWSSFAELCKLVLPALIHYCKSSAELACIGLHFSSLCQVARWFS